MSREFTVNVKGQPKHFCSDLTDEQACQIVAERVAPRSTFASDMLAKADRQLWALAWVHKLAIDASRPAAPLLDADLTKLVTLFERAHAHLKYPKIEFQIDGQTIRINRAGERSKSPGTLHVAAGGYGSQYFGSIDTDGNFAARNDCPEFVRAALTEMASDPAKFAHKHGTGSGRCIFCQLKLTDSRSLLQGYGPVCAKNWGLAWGDGRELHSVEAMTTN
jgi:hypothetical protein